MSAEEQSNAALLSHRIRRLYAGLQRVAPASIDSIPVKAWRTDKRVAMLHDFSGGESEDQIRELITQIVYNVAHVKDPLKKHVSSKGHSAETVEQFINGSQPLKLIIDIANREKHGYPADRPSRSGLHPQLGEVGRSLQLRTGAQAGSYAMYTIDPKTGRPVVRASGGGGGAVVYRGEVRGKDGTVIGDVLEIAKDAVSGWEHLFSTLGISL